MTETFTKKIALAAGSAAAAALPVAADAAVVTNTTPVSISLFDLAPTGAQSVALAPWDIDGDTDADLTLFAIGTLNTEGTFVKGNLGFGQPLGAIGSNRVLGLFNTTAVSSIMAVPTSLQVSSGSPPSGYNFRTVVLLGGGSSATYGSSFLKGIAAGTGLRTTASGSVFYSTGIPANQFSYGTHNFAFGFADDGVGHFGWGVLTLEPLSLTIEEWTFNTLPAGAPNSGVHVGTVPEPAATLPAIALLAAGAAGVRTWRKRKADGVAD